MHKTKPANLKSWPVFICTVLWGMIYGYVHHPAIFIWYRVIPNIADCIKT